MFSEYGAFLYIKANLEVGNNIFDSPVFPHFREEEEEEYTYKLENYLDDQSEPKGMLIDEEKEEENQDNINYDKMNPKQNDEDFYSKKITEQKEQTQKELSGSTGLTSENKIESIKKSGEIFQTAKKLEKNWRFDMAKKHWKTKISKVASKEINKLIKESDLPQSLKMKIHTPNSKLFTANVNVQENFIFLSKNLRDIFTIGKESEDLQEQNNKILTKIYNHFEKIGDNNLSEKSRKVKNFLDMKYEELIRKFYESDEFLEFKEQQKTKFYDEGTSRQEGFSLTEDYGLIKLFKMLNKKRSRDEF